MARARPSWAWLAAEALVVLAAVSAWGTGDPGASGIVEERLGGPGTALVVGLALLAIPAVVAGVVAGALGPRPGRRRRAAVAIRGLGILVLGALAAMWVIVATEAECDGSCNRRPTSTLWAAVLAAELALAVGLAVAVLVDHVVGRRARRTG